MPTKPSTVKELLDALPEDRRKAIQAIRKVIKANLDKQFAEGIQYGMLGYFLPHKVYPAGYHCDTTQPLPFASVASQKNHIGLYLFCIYCHPEESARFREEWLASGKKLDMGKSCVRVKSLDDVPLEVVGRAIKRMTAKKFVAAYEESVPAAAQKKPAAKKQAAARKPAASKATAKKKVTKKAAARKTVAQKPAAKQKPARKAAPRRS
ncbi:MAG: DUF1801 domain-containing protein [Planctomycetota bacterium]|nr:DUF1801 domain-containing protein [Planctomycetota bacterium]